MATLADLIRKRRESGKSVTSSLSYGLKEKFKEKIDPRRFLDQSGILTALFPQLKAYKSGGKESPNVSRGTLKSNTPELIQSNISFDSIETNTKITAKNTLVLPAMHRDINVMRQNLVKLVKLKGGNPTNKADMYFMNARTMEAAYESKYKRGKPDKIEKPVGEKEENRGILDNVKMMIEAAIAGALGSVTKNVVSSAASKLFPTVFSWASIPALGLALASQQAGDADLNNQQQGIVDPIKRAYEKAQEGDLSGVAEEIGNINVFTAAGRFGMEKGLGAYEDLGFKQKHEEIRESNLSAERDMTAGQSSAFQVGLGDKGVAKAISVMEQNIQNEKDPARKIELQKALDNYKESYAKTIVKNPTPVTKKSKKLTPSPTPDNASGKQIQVQSKVESPTPSTPPRTVATIVDEASTETKQVQEEVSKTPIVNIIETTSEKTISTPPQNSTGGDVASVYDNEFLKLLGMEIA